VNVGIDKPGDYTVTGVVDKVNNSGVRVAKLCKAAILDNQKTITDAVLKINFVRSNNHLTLPFFFHV